MPQDGNGGFQRGIMKWEKGERELQRKGNYRRERFCGIFTSSGLPQPSKRGGNGILSQLHLLSFLISTVHSGLCCGFIHKSRISYQGAFILSRVFFSYE